MKKLYDFVLRLVEYIVILLMIAMTLLVVVAVIFRKAGHSISWYDEFAGYILVWVTFWGAVIALERKRHIGFESLVELMPKSIQKMVMSVVYIFLIFLNLVLIKYGWRLTTELTGETAITLPVPIGYINAVLPITASLMLILCLIQIVEVWFKKEGEQS
ncbi:MAG TPA: TRAP transporter small permease [Nitrospinota bacterium]|nr:TRAP transporter small permease [Nitrospinota bacterium]